MNMFHAFMAAIALSMPLALGSDANVYYLPKDSLMLIGEVEFDNSVTLASAINAGSQKGEREITLLINSPGGDVLAGIILIGAMRQAHARGTTISCVVPILAASMAFHVLAACDRRIALRESFLLFHEMYQGAQHLTGRDAEHAAFEMKQMSDLLDPILLKELGVSKAIFDKHNQLQTMWTAQSFTETFPKFHLQLVDVINSPEGVDIYATSTKQ